MPDTLRERIAQQIDKLDWYECTIEETLDAILPVVEQVVAEKDAQIAALQVELADFRRGQARHLSKMRPAGETPAPPQEPK